MKIKGSWQGLCTVGVGIGLAVLSGCQTNVAGMTLPSGRYLQHPPQYIPPSPPFPLSRELASMEGGAGAGPQGALPAGPEGAPAPPLPGAPGLAP